ncbi:MAG: hypothetical protein JO042_02425, partial [Sinobacteraceae bacterium]|nr:hypothetical protein [Nevskiaceae bacterium]
MESTSCETADRDITGAVQAARLDFAFNNLPMSLIVSAVLAAMTAGMLHRSTDLTLMLTWLACLIGVNAIRF